MSMADPETSVIIRTFNEAKCLPALLERLRDQSYRDFEIVVVDSGSLDRTRDIAASHTDKLLRIDSHDFTFGYSLNVGISAASGKYSALVSAHTLPLRESWLGTLIEPLRRESTAMSFGKQVGGATSKFSELQDLRRTFGPRRRVLHPPHFFAHNANSAIRNDLWQQHPFDETLAGLEDVEWAKYWMLQGYEVVYEPEAALHHIHEEHWRQIRRRYYREAVAARSIGIKGRHYVLIEPAREAALALRDFGRVLGPSREQNPVPGTRLQKSREVVLYRVNKALGTVRGLLDGNMMQDTAARESFFFNQTCQAVVVQAPGRASVQEIPIPEIKPGEVLIGTAYCGVSGTDLEVFEGSLIPHHNSLSRYPIVPGHELSGRVLDFGPNVNGLQEGDGVVVESIQVCGNCAQCHRSNWNSCQHRVELGVIGKNGGYSQYVVVPSRFVHRLQPDQDLRTSTLCEPLAVILKGLNRLSRHWPSESEFKRCAVVGAGSLGHLCARVLASRGHLVTVFDRDPLRRSYFDGSAIEASDDLTRLNEFDLLVELTGDPEALDTMLNESAAGATILLLGLPYAHKQFTFEKLVAYDKTVVGSLGSSSADFEQAIKLLPELDLELYLQCELPLDQYREAWELFRQRKHLKVLLSASGDSS